MLLLRWRLAEVQQVWPSLAGFFVAAAIVALAAALASLPVTAASMGGDWRSAIDSSIIGAVLRHTRFGNLLVLRLAGSFTLLIACMRTSTLRFEAVCILSAALLILLSLTSHAAASAGAPDLALPRAANDAAHLLAGGFWLGSLVVLISLFNAPVGNGANFLRPVQLFSEWGTYAVALLVVSGTVNVATLLFGGRTTWSSAYQQLLAAKVGLAAIMIVLAAINRWRLAPAARGGDQQAPRALSRNITAELTLGLGVIAVAGIIGSIAPG
ncbi:MAG TPA: CopD family protein [Rhizomicrobium sp.]|nr:CopD family protein [Rhizomicrobium sp.]